jgi:Polyketide cyclase / dehydrase and lipid transport
MSANDPKRTCKPRECYPNGAIILDKTTGQMMQTKTTVTRKMTVSAAKTWDAIAKVGRLDVWFPTISTCVVEGSGVGAIRPMDLARGGKIGKMRLTYERVESPFPVTAYRGTVEVFESFDGLGVVVWTIDFESTPENSPVVNAQLEDALARGIEGMKADLAAAT